MDRRATPPTPAPAVPVPACADCIRMENQQHTAEHEGDLSGAVDWRVKLRRHRAEVHEVQQ